jgi:hypothetical protein
MISDQMTGGAAAEPGSSCSEKERLMHALVVATLDYSRAVVVIQERAGVMKKDPYRRMRSYLDEARAKLEEALRGAGAARLRTWLLSASI